MGTTWISGSADGLSNARELVLRVVVEMDYTTHRVRNGVDVLVIINARNGGYISDGYEIPVCVHDLDGPEQRAWCRHFQSGSSGHWLSRFPGSQSPGESRNWESPGQHSGRCCCWLCSASRFGCCNRA